MCALIFFGLLGGKFLSRLPLAGNVHRATKLCPRDETSSKVKPIENPLVWADLEIIWN